MTEIPYRVGRAPLPSLPVLHRLEKRHWLGIVMLLAVSALTLTPVLYVICASFDVSDIGMPFKFGLAGWKDVLTNRNSASAIYYSFLLALRVPIATVFAFVAHPTASTSATSASKAAAGSAASRTGRPTTR